MTVQSTSRLSYARDAFPVLGDRQHEVYEAIRNASGSLTNSEIAEAIGNPINTVTPRVFELRGLGLVKEDIRRSCSITGRTAIAWTMADQDMPEILVI